MLVTACPPKQVLGGKLADGGVVRHDLIAPERPLAIRHQPDGWERFEPRLHSWAWPLTVQKNSIDISPADAAEARMDRRQS